MRDFKFLANNNDLTNVVVPDIIRNTAIEFCRTYKRYVDSCRNNYLVDNPDVDPSLPYSFPIPYVNIEELFPEGRLWHCGSDYYEDEDKLLHYVFLDMENSHGDIFFEIVETDDGEFYFDKIDWDYSREEV
jgi:hypothetical protein